MTHGETLNQIAGLRHRSRADRIERAKQFTDDFNQLAADIKNGLAWEDIEAEMQDFLLGCSEAVFHKFESLVGRAPRVVRGQHFTEPRKAS